ncbi:MAG: PilZ domain-containing protein [Terriglobia bacterium]
MKRGESERGAHERRERPRFRTGESVRAVYGGRQFPLENLSVAGALIRTDDPLAVGTEVEVDLVGKSLSEPIELTAVVIRSEAGGMAVEFRQFHRRARLELMDCVAMFARDRQAG